ncbi:MAG: MBL fold metallo-hydrolase [Candidatus Heimdallarchaeota archaeon]|nr:MBL fold metallo-hydrolase [Candidatus Heimdallarchaeota archaeon]
MSRRFSSPIFPLSGSFFSSESVFVLEKPSGDLLLVDAGLDPAARHILSGFTSHWGGLSRLEGIIFTHRHPDHVGGLPMILNALQGRQIPLIAHEKTAERFNEFLPQTTPQPFSITHTVKHDEIIDASLRLRAIHTPGHTYGHLCLLLEDEGVLLAADLFMRLFGLLQPVFKKYHDDFALWRRTLPLVLEYEWDYAVPTHRKPKKIPRKRVEQFIHRMAQK